MRKFSTSLGVELGVWLQREAERILSRRHWSVHISDQVVTSLDQLRDHLADTGELLVWSGGSEHTVYGSRFANYAARVVHDVVHLDHNLQFTTVDERRVAEIQREHAIESGLRQDLIDLLWFDTASQTLYEATHGRFPSDQLGFCRHLYEGNPITSFKDMHHA